MSGAAARRRAPPGPPPSRRRRPSPSPSRRRRRRPDRTAAERNRRHRRRVLHAGRAFFRFEADVIGLEDMLRAAGQITAIEPSRADIEAALTKFIGVLIADHDRNAS